ncbi:hypothetical protein [Sedimenticola thiotaurini]|uniref:hypothetical protein n=1 Tax=Sedimenticola thiotaurini TaxID=1543721 RepID=UPI0018FFB40E|nr:hypothetical protein [Sedimenticola thiotaurini]
MSEISQPTPIKPSWPVRRDESRRKRPEADPKGKKDKKPVQEPLPDEGDRHPQIDDYA